MDNNLVGHEIAARFFCGEAGFLEAATPSQLVDAALQIMEHQHQRGTVISLPGQVRKYLRLKIGRLEHEVFAVLLLDGQHRLLAYEEVFRGTIDGCVIYSREVAKIALANNAAAVIVAHNHPSGVAEPSKSDRRMTEKLKEALALIDVQVLDHLVVGGEGVVSFTERGWL